MRRLAARAVLLAALAGCGVRAQHEPEILRSPPTGPTATTPSATEQPTPSPTPTPSSTG